VGKTGVKRFGKAQDKFVSELVFFGRQGDGKPIGDFGFYPDFHCLEDIFKRLRIGVPVARTAVEFLRGGEVIPWSILGSIPVPGIIRNADTFLRIAHRNTFFCLYKNTRIYFCVFSTSFGQKLLYAGEFL
jgi:hypothetical protein